MGYAEIIEKLQKLPEEKQAEVLDFVEFLAARLHREPFSSSPQGGALAELRAHPFLVKDFRPMSREEANAR